MNINSNWDDVSDWLIWGLCDLVGKMGRGQARRLPPERRAFIRDYKVRIVLGALCTRLGRTDIDALSSTASPAALGRAATQTVFESPLTDSLRGMLRSQRGAFVPVGALVKRLRAKHPTLTSRQIEKLLPRVMTAQYDSAKCNDIPGANGFVRGYRGVAFKKGAK